MTLNVLVQPASEKEYPASIWGLPDVAVEGQTKEDALEKIRVELDK